METVPLGKYSICYYHLIITSDANYICRDQKDIILKDVIYMQRSLCLFFVGLLFILPGMKITSPELQGGFLTIKTPEEFTMTIFV